MTYRRLLLAAVLAIPAAVLAVDPATPPAAPNPDLPDGSEKARRQMANFRLPPGMRVDLFAAEPMLASPVAISVDEKGVVYVAEEYRLGRGAAENRDNPAFKFSFTLQDDLQIRTVDDRLALYRKHADKFPGGMKYFTTTADQVRRLEDTTGSGRADKSTVFAGGFNGPLDGLAAGVLARDGDVYLTNIPSLYRLRDTKGTGVADVKDALLTGFGTNIAFFGHDLHGLIFGPDGKLYFSVGDRGFHVATKEGPTVSGPRTGAVFRCDPDGSHLEVVMRGLRNPQELAFDQYGNLFADDNNCDRGDHARLVYVVDDGDAGWNMAYQTIPDPYTAGPWFAERMWHLPHAGQPGWIVPPVGKIGTGPSGFLFTSGTSLPDRYTNSFIMCNYAGGRGLEAFKVVPKGAGFEIADYHDFLTPIMATDAEVGVDGKLYVSDFVNLDWGGKSLGGRIYTVSDPAKLQTAVVQEMKQLFADGFKHRKPDELAKLLGHVDQKVRLRAQWELARRGAESVAVFTDVFDHTKDQLARIHAVWGLGQLAAAVPDALVPLRVAIGDPDPEVRAQAVKVVGASGRDEMATAVRGRLVDDSPRVKFFAAQAVGKFKHRPAIPLLFDLLARTKDADPFLRHACVAALARIGDADAVAHRAGDPNPAVRLAVVLVQRRLGDRRVTKLLADADPLVRVEAARVVHDVLPDDALPQLADQLPSLKTAPPLDLDPLARRCVDAAFRRGAAADAQAVLDVAGNAHFSPAVRSDAIHALGDWANPPQRDRVTGFWRPVGPRNPAEMTAVRAVVEAGLPALLANTTGRLQTAAVNLISWLNLKADEGMFAGWVADRAKDVNVRVAALRVLSDRKSPALAGPLATALADPAPLLRAEARDVLAASDPARAVALFAAVLGDPSAATVERQRAVDILPKLKRPDSDKLLEAQALKLAAGEVPPELRLDVWEAAKSAPSPVRDAARAKFEKTLPEGLHRKFGASLVGGDAERGRDVFLGHAAAQCIRCHAVKGVGGNAGPDLTTVAARYPDKTREFFLESLLVPSAKIAPGFGAITLTLADGRVLSGTLLSDDTKGVTVQLADGKKVTAAADDIEKRTTPLSPMPSVEKSLSAREVRDVVEYLTTLK